jgi:uncharacterized membrane protein
MIELIASFILAALVATLVGVLLVFILCVVVGGFAWMWFVVNGVDPPAPVVIIFVGLFMLLTMFFQREILNNSRKARDVPTATQSVDEERPAGDR